MLVIVLRRRAGPSEGGRTSREVWRAEDLEPGFSGLLNVSFHSSFFAAGDYLLVVDAVTADGGSVLVGRHGFRVLGGPSDTPG